MKVGMEAVFKTILCPVDFDRISIPALELARRLADASSATILLAYAVPVAEAAEDLDTVARENLRAIARKWLEGKVAYEIKVVTGNPAEAIVKAAGDLHAEVIVMATHGRVGSEHDRLGSVAEKVVQSAPCPVLTVKPGPRA